MDEDSSRTHHLSTAYVVVSCTPLYIPCFLRNGERREKFLQNANNAGRLDIRGGVKLTGTSMH